LDIPHVEQAVRMRSDKEWRDIFNNANINLLHKIAATIAAINSSRGDQTPDRRRGDPPCTRSRRRPKGFIQSSKS
jgi:hypothetical protein